MNTPKLDKLYEEMMDEKGLIPEMGDAKHYWPAIVLRIGRLLYENWNNGMCNYYMEDEDDGLYHEFERTLNEFGQKYGFGNLGSLIVHGKDEEIEKVVEKVADLVREKEDEWDKISWKPLY